MNEISKEKQGIAVIGLGFIGLPLALSFAMREQSVVGIDVIPELIAEINQGVSHHLEQHNGRSIKEILNEQLAATRFIATDDYQYASERVSSYIVTVGIPIDNGVANYEYIDSACESIAKVLKKGDTVIIRSTVIPGTTEMRLQPLLEKISGLVAGHDFYLAYASERIAEGRAFVEFETMPLALGGVNELSAKRAKDILTVVTKAEVTISDIKTVETAKVIENIQRDVNIAMVQEFASFAQAFNIDTNELIKVANTHTRVNLLTPGPGVGGYCLPNAFYYLLPQARQLGVSLELLQTARTINEHVPAAIVCRIEKSLGALAGKKIAVLGLAMKDYSNDDRISPPLDIVKLLLDKGAEVYAYDPAVMTRYDFKYEDLDYCLDGAVGLLLLTMQAQFRDLDWLEIAGKMVENSVIFDAKNVISKEDIAKSKAKLLKI